MNDTIEYRPYKTHAYFVVFILCIATAALMLAGYCMQKTWLLFLVCFVFSLMCVFLAKVLYDTSNAKIILDSAGVRIIGNPCGSYQFVPWERIRFAYAATNYKGHLFLVLTPCELNEKQKKHYANKSANTSRICVDSAVVIYMDITQSVEHIKDLIEQQVINTYL